MVVERPFKPSTLFTDTRHINERIVWQYEEKGFVWIIRVENGEMVRDKARAGFMSLKQALEHKANQFDPDWRQVTEEEAVMFLFPDRPTTIMGDAW